MATQSSAYFVVFALTSCFLCSAMISKEAKTVRIAEIDIAGRFSGKADIEADKTASSFVKNEGIWCIVKPSTPDDQLNRNIAFACSQRQHPIYNCTMIEQGGPCYNPTNKASNASVVMHLYYEFYGKHPHNCDFNGSGIIIDTDPCRFHKCCWDLHISIVLKKFTRICSK